MNRQHWRADLADALGRLRDLRDEASMQWTYWRAACADRRRPSREGNPHIQNFPRIVISEDVPKNAAYLINYDFIHPRPESL